MNRVQAILVSLFLAASVQSARAGVLMPAAPQPGWTAVDKAIDYESSATRVAESEGTESYSSPGSMGGEKVPEAVQPSDEGTGSPSESGTENEGGKNYENKEPMGTGRMPETVNPEDKSGDTGAPSDTAPGPSNY